MKICVLVKQVPDKNDEIKLNPESLSVDKSNFNFITNESDNYAEVAKEQISKMGIKDDKIIPIIQLERGKDNEAIASRSLFEKYNIKSVLIVTPNWHILRTYLTYKKVFAEKPITFYLAPVESEKCRADNWWKNHDGLEYLFSGCLKLINYWYKGYI